MIKDTGKIKARDILGVDVKEIKTGSELVYLKELNRYIKELVGKSLDVKGIKIDQRVVEGEHFSYVYDTADMGWKCDVAGLELADYSATVRKYFEDDLSGVVFSEQTEDKWVYSYHTDKTANIVLNGYNRSMGYVSLQAYMTVMHYLKGQKTPVLRLENYSHKQEELEYADILILEQYGNRWLKGKVELQYSEKTVVQPEWEAYILYRRQLGYMLGEVSADEKRAFMEKNYKIGDVVLYYTTEKTIKTKTIRRLKSCYPAVITKMTPEGVGLVYYPLIETTLTRRKRLLEIEEELGLSYEKEDYELYQKTPVFLDYRDSGFCDYTYTEDKFILEVIEGRDTTEQFLETCCGLERLVELGTRDTVYAVFEDRGVAYNKDRFLERYFAGRQPEYDTIIG